VAILFPKPTLLAMRMRLPDDALSSIFFRAFTTLSMSLNWTKAKEFPLACRLMSTSWQEKKENKKREKIGHFFAKIFLVRETSSTASTGGNKKNSNSNSAHKLSIFARKTSEKPKVLLDKIRKNLSRDTDQYLSAAIEDGFQIFRRGTLSQISHVESSGGFRVILVHLIVLQTIISLQEWKKIIKNPKDPKVSRNLSNGQGEAESTRDN
jgi:hypothetical protein